MNNIEICNFYTNFCERNATSLPRSTNKWKKMELAATELLSVRPDVDFKGGNVCTIAKKMLRVLEKKPHSRERMDEDWMNTVVFTKKKSNPAAAGRPAKRLSHEVIHVKTEDKILMPMKDTLELFAANEGISNEDALAKLVAFCSRKWKLPKKKPAKKEITEEESTALLYNLNLSQRQYQYMRQFLYERDFIITTRNKLSLFIPTLLPELRVEPLKCSVSFLELLKTTTTSIIEELIREPIDLSGGELFLTAKFGLDGSGAHPHRHQREAASSAQMHPLFDTECSSTFIGTYFAPLHISLDKEGTSMVWKNRNPGSIFYTRAISLLRAKEEREIIESEVSDVLKDIQHLRTVPIQIEIDDITIDLHCHIETSMVDGKMAGILQGDTGSYCHYCNCTKEDGNSLVKILEGFKISKTFEECSDIIQKLESGEIRYKDKERCGQVHAPILKTDLRYFAITHTMMRSLDNILKVYYRLVSGQLVWGDSHSGFVKGRIADAKKKAQDHVKAKCNNLLIDAPSPVGGNTNTGNTTMRFLSPCNREAIGELIPGSETREAFLELLKYFNKMLTVVQHASPNVVNIDKIKYLGIDLMRHFKQNFPWAVISQSVHQMAGHVWELYQLNNGQPISAWSEAPVEGWNKNIKAYKSGPACRARQTSVNENIQDVFTRMLIVTHPKVLKYKRELKCSHCDKVGHTKRSCPDLKEKRRDAESEEIEYLYI